MSKSMHARMEKCREYKFDWDVYALGNLEVLRSFVSNLPNPEIKYVPTDIPPNLSCAALAEAYENRFGRCDASQLEYNIYYDESIVNVKDEIGS